MKVNSFTKKYKIVVFDFDGVIIDSAAIKTDAFYQLFKSDELLDFHKKNTGLSRFIKFKYYYDNIKKVPVTDEMMQELNKKFNAIVMEKIINAEFVPGVIELLEKLYRDKKLYICSGTPIDELNEIVALKKLQKYFHGIYGQPENKCDILLKIIKDNNAEKKELLFIGDGLSDYQAAESTGVNFLALLNNENSYYFDKMDIPKIYYNFLSMREL